jgi:hypothetical protein
MASMGKIIPSLRFRSAQALLVGATVTFAALVAAPASASVVHTTGIVNGVDCDIWTWSDSANQQRTVALKIEGGLNAGNGHGGYAVQMTYYYTTPLSNIFRKSPWTKVTVNAANETDGGFGYFVSHERYRFFQDGAWATIANKIFNTDDSPLGLEFQATASILPNGSSHPFAESFTIAYGHYGTIEPHGYDSNSGEDVMPLPVSNVPVAYQFYSIPVTTTWVFESGKDFPRIDVSVDMSQIPKAGLVSFDMRGPYGVMVFDDGADATVTTAMWGDQDYLFVPLQTPITRSSGWNWSSTNPGARYNLISTGNYEMGLFEPLPSSKSSLVDGYAAERGFTNASFAAAEEASADNCGDPQTLPSDGTWPYQSLQYSLLCQGQSTNYLTQTTTGKKIAWGSSSLYGSEVTSVYNGQKNHPISFSPTIKYSVCLALSAVQEPWPPYVWSEGRLHVALALGETIANAALYTNSSPSPSNSDCATSTP